MPPLLPRSSARLLAAALLAASAAACVPGGAPASPRPGGETMRAFRSERALSRFFRDAAEEQRRRMERERKRSEGIPIPVMPEPVAMPAPSEPAPTAAPAPSPAPAAAGAAESVTSVQTAGVDEGGIVKVHGDHLVMLRRGRLFTVRIGDGELRPVSAVDAFAPEADPRRTWLDEMLVSDSIVAVIGFSYERGGTEVGLFSIDAAGGLRHRSTYHLRSNDYYSSRNYASRLVGGKLVFYTPLELEWEGDEEGEMPPLPALRRWHKDATAGEFRPIVPATRVYRPERRLDPDNLVLHTVTSCDLAGGEMACQATAVLGPEGRVFYVSAGSVYVWLSGEEQEEGRRSRRAPGMAYRLPLDGSAPSALGVWGSPVDQFSFLESADGHLNVVVRSEGEGDAMWGAEHGYGDVGLVRLPLAAFGDGADDAPASAFRRLPTPGGGAFQNRYVGPYLLYGTGSGWGRPRQGGWGPLYAVRWAGADSAARLPLEHAVDRIEALGADAVAVGSDGRDLHFSGVRLGDGPALAGRYTLPRASQGETRSHGFFYRPDGPDAGTLGLPVRGAGEPGAAQLTQGSASVLFLRNQALRLSELGRLEARPEDAANDGCVASCVHWYGNARPLFLRGRVFALMGYEIVEGTVEDGRIREIRRVNYAPRARAAAGN